MTVSRKCSGESIIQDGDSPLELPAKRGFYLSYRGKILLSRIDPIGQAERLAADFPLKGKTLYFCPSPLYGYGLTVLLGRMGPDSAVLCVEADKKLFQLSQKALKELSGCQTPPSNEQFKRSSPSSIVDGKLKALALVKASDAESVCAFAQETWGSRAFRRIELLRLSGGWQLYPQLYSDMEEALRREMAIEWGNAMTLIRLGRLYSRNLIKNFGLFLDDNVATVDFSSSPVLVLGAGPSLDSLLDELVLFWGRKNREKRRFRIVCADTCLPALIEREIRPDLVVVLESQHWNLADFAGARGQDIDAAIDLSALPASTRILAGKRFCIATPWANLAFLERLKNEGFIREILPPLGSVGLTATALALRATSGPVLTCGIDFSYTLDAYHARSTPGHRSLLCRQSRFKSIINAAAAFRAGSFCAFSKTGTQVRSDPSMRNYRDLFEREFGGNSRLFDINGSGLPLGVKTISSTQALAILNDAGEGQDLESFALVPQRIKKKPATPLIQREKIAAFIQKETGALKALKDMLSGEIPLDTVHLEKLLDAADYLWAHFPESAGIGRRPPITNLNFLKRVKTEIDPFLKLWELSLRELKDGR